MQLDEARHQQIALDVKTAGRCIAFAELDDPASGNGHPALLNDPIREDQPGIA